MPFRLTNAPPPPFSGWWKPASGTLILIGASSILEEIVIFSKDIASLPHDAGGDVPETGKGQLETWALQMWAIPQADHISWGTLSLPRE